MDYRTHTLHEYATVTVGSIAAGLLRYITAGATAIADLYMFYGDRTPS